ncbi:MAG: TldD/PmbA family protein [Pseudomonadota bacterium]
MSAIKEMNPAGYANRFAGYTELRMQRNASTNVTLLNGDLTGNARAQHSGVSARVFKDGIWGFASRPELDEAQVLATIDDATANARFLARRSGRAGSTLSVDRAECNVDFSTAGPRRTQAETVDFLNTLDAHITSTYPGLKSRIVQLADLDMEKQFCNSDGSSAYSNITRSLVIVSLVRTNAAGEPVTVRKAFGGRGQFEDVFARPSELYDDIAGLHGHLVNKVDAVVPRAGVHDVIMDSELAGILAHEAIGHTTEADLVREGSVAGDYVGKQVASPLVSMVDYAHTRDGETLPVPVYVDDEGVTGRDVWLIKDGILQDFMHNKESAHHFSHELTGNARAYQFFDEPLIRMRNTAILPGRDKLEDMIASVEDGYYLMWPSNGQADSTSEFMFGISLGYEIKEGKLGRAITDTTISGVAFDMLKTVTMVSDEMNWGCAGMCGKKQIIPVGMGGPAIRCRIHVGGE